MTLDISCREFRRKSSIIQKEIQKYTTTDMDDTDALEVDRGLTSQSRKSHR